MIPIAMTPKNPSSTAGTSKEKRPISQPSVNVISFCIFLVGIGTLLGYATFYVTFQTKCSNLLLDQTERHNETHAQLQTKYSRALDDVRQCQDDAQTKGELQELQGRLQAQAALSNKHQDLLERHEKTLERISVLQQSNEGSQAQIQTLREGIKIVKVSLEESTLQLQEAQQEHHDIQHQLQGQIDDTNRLIQEKSQENAQLRNSLGSCEHLSQGSAGKLDELKNLVQQQNFAQVIAKYGEGPYIIRFDLQFLSEPVASNFLEIKIFSARHLPHTVLTVLNMIDNGLYVDTTIDFVNNGVVRGGNPMAVEPQSTKSGVLRRFANFGYSAHNTLFFDNESSPDTPCRHSSFGLLERGPGFKIYMTNDNNNDSIDGGNHNNCPGIITKGRETMERLVAQMETNEHGELVSKVRIMATSIRSVSQEDEL